MRLDMRPDAASASGKLVRMDGKTIDSTGIIMLREQRHLDRGADQSDSGQFDLPEDIFGPSGAAAMYRKSALDDVSIDGQYFDEDFSLIAKMPIWPGAAACSVGVRFMCQPRSRGIAVA